MPHEKLKDLLRKYLDGTATRDEERVVNDWYNSLSEKKDARLEEPLRSHLRASYWNAIKAAIRVKRSERPMWPRLVAVAASVSLLAVVFFYALPGAHDNHVAQTVRPLPVKVVDNPSSEIMMIQLPDSSTVTLFPNSTLRYDEDFNVAQRKVDLTGQAFFEIFHDAEKPFSVFANEVVATVLGTSFSVTAYPADDSVTVMVKTGRVSVLARTMRDDGELEDKEVVLVRNEQAIYDRSAYQVALMRLDQPNVVIRHEEALKVRFDATPLSEVFETLEKLYKVDIEFDEAVFSTCSITTVASGKDMYERIDVICEIIGATYTIEGNRILINGTGCN